MPLQNRVLPTGEIVAHPARGLLMGNRGCIHRPDRTLGLALVMFGVGDAFLAAAALTDFRWSVAGAAVQLVGAIAAGYSPLVHPSAGPISMRIFADPS